MSKFKFKFAGAVSGLGQKLEYAIKDDRTALISSSMSKGRTFPIENAFDVEITQENGSTHYVCVVAKDSCDAVCTAIDFFGIAKIKVEPMFVEDEQKEDE